MILRQTAALFVDAYRELNAKKLFWITMILSLLVVVAFALTGVSDEGIHALWFTIPGTAEFGAAVEPGTWYKFLFSAFGIQFWLTWIATILALVSTAGIFPDLLASGSIDLVLSKPISRLRLFLTKYATGLLFAALQVFVFSGASFLVIGIRGGSWIPEILLAVPIVVVFFSYLFGICVLIGVVTRSTVASLLLTLLVWFVFFIVNTTEAIFLGQKAEREFDIAYDEAYVAFATPRAEELRLEIAEAEADPDVEVNERDQRRLERWTASIEEKREEIERANDSLKPVDRWHGYIMTVKTFIPKTGETIGLLDRYLIELDELSAFMPDREVAFEEPGENDDAEPSRIKRPDEVRSPEMRVQDYMRSRSMTWVVGTSLAFEGVLLVVALALFRRRDF